MTAAATPDHWRRGAVPCSTTPPRPCLAQAAGISRSGLRGPSAPRALPHRRACAAGGGGGAATASCRTAGTRWRGCQGEHAARKKLLTTTAGCPQEPTRVRNETARPATRHRAPLRLPPLDVDTQRRRRAKQPCRPHMAPRSEAASMRTMQPAGLCSSAVPDGNAAHRPAGSHHGMDVAATPTVRRAGAWSPRRPAPLQQPAVGYPLLAAEPPTACPPVDSRTAWGLRGEAPSPQAGPTGTCACWSSLECYYAT